MAAAHIASSLSTMHISVPFSQQAPSDASTPQSTATSRAASRQLMFTTSPWDRPYSVGGVVPTATTKASDSDHRGRSGAASAPMFFDDNGITSPTLFRDDGTRRPSGTFQALNSTAELTE
jgi:hypothetical protein